MSCNYKFYNRDRLKKDWFSGQRIIYTAVQQMMQGKKEYWKILLLLSSTTRFNRAGAGDCLSFSADPNYTSAELKFNYFSN
jgi:hypothetical protein